MLIRIQKIIDSNGISLNNGVTDIICESNSLHLTATETIAQEDVGITEGKTTHYRVYAINNQLTGSTYNYPVHAGGMNCMVNTKEEHDMFGVSSD